MQFFKNESQNYGRGTIQKYTGPYVPTNRKYTVTSSGWRGPPISSIKYLAASKCCTADRGLAVGIHDVKYKRVGRGEERKGKVRLGKAR